METYTFEMVFKLPDPEEDPNNYIDALHGKAEFDDATIGAAGMGRIYAVFERKGLSVFLAMSSAKVDVCKAIPGAELVSIEYHAEPQSER